MFQFGGLGALFGGTNPPKIPPVATVLSECTNYRGISLLSFPGRVPAKFVEKNTRRKIEGYLEDTKCGFRRARSITEQLSIFQQIFVKSWELAKDSYTCFVDLRKVYGWVSCEMLWGMLQEYGVDGCLLLAVKLLYFCSEDCVCVDRVKSQPFIVGVGLRQWCVLSPLLFTVYIKVLQSTARSPNPTCEAISPGCKTHFADNEKIIYVQKMCS